jgi:hypothetical protein
MITLTMIKGGEGDDDPIVNKYKKEEIFDDDKKRIFEHRYFLLCESCFWCASYLNMGGLTPVDKCPLCHDNRIEWMTISHDEIYQLGYNSTSGVTLEFSKQEKGIAGDMMSSSSGEKKGS